MAQSFPMNGGDGTYSYTKNSQYQKQASDFVKEMIKETITEKLDTEILESISSTFRIVDFGCSVGPNTFFAVENMIEAVQKKCCSKNMEFHVFFNDHAENDFNTLFASLPADRQYYALATPGSFYGRLFPRDSITLAYLSYALQWLSKVPDEICDKKSTAWNEGKFHYTGSSREVIDAYANQFEKDMGNFLSARGEEFLGGGLMVLIMPGIPDEKSHLPHSGGVMINFLESSLMDLASEGIIDKAEIDAFNLPFYVPTVEEMRKAIDKNGCFKIERIDAVDLKSQACTMSLNVQSLIMHFRAGMERVFTKHFGREVMEKTFFKTLAKSEENFEFFNSKNPNSTQLSVVLKRK